MSAMRSARVPVGLGAVQAGEGRIPFLSRKRRGGGSSSGSLWGCAPGEEVGRSSLAQARSSFSSKREHRGDEARGGLAMGTNSGSPTGSIGATEGVILAAALVPLASLAIDQEMLRLVGADPRSGAPP